jgi:hypothetical protein
LKAKAESDKTETSRAGVLKPRNKRKGKDGFDHKEHREHKEKREI